LSGAAAQPGIAADRFAREIVRFLTLLPARSRQLNAKPFGGCGSVVGTPFCVFHPARSATPVVPVSVVPVRVVLAWYDRPWCGKRVVQRWYEGP